MMERKIKILLVDDEADFRGLMTFWLESKGYIVIQAADGERAIELARKEKPDILFLDLRMPVMNGTEVLKRIRKFNQDLPVIVISAHINDPGSEEILSYGVSGVFSKDKNFDEALLLLEAALRTHKKLKK